MSIFEDDRPAGPKAPRITVGEDLSALSEDELAERITALEAEVLRIRQALEHRGSVRTAADALFSRT